jgi:hypothetical protein
MGLVYHLSSRRQTRGPLDFNSSKKKNQIQRLTLDPQLFPKIERTCGFHERTDKENR